MRQTPRPAMHVRDVFMACCHTIQDQDRKDRLIPNSEAVERASSDYSVAGENGRIHAFDAKNYTPLGTATTADFEWLYKQRLVNSREGRKYYRQLRDGNNERYALCNVRDATTLDHHLPKSAFPVLAVTPDNLLPACDACNHIKLADTTPTLNTYFDDLGPGKWLRATIVAGKPYTPSTT